MVHAAVDDVVGGLAAGNPRVKAHAAEGLRMKHEAARTSGVGTRQARTLEGGLEVGIEAGCLPVAVIPHIALTVGVGAVHIDLCPLVVVGLGLEVAEEVVGLGCCGCALQLDALQIHGTRVCVACAVHAKVPLAGSKSCGNGE